MAGPVEPERVSVVLVAPRNPLNIGAAARAMSNFGFSDLRVVNPYEVAFREARSAVGAAELLAEAREYKTTAEAVADCVLVVGTTAARARQLEQPLKTPAQAAPLIRKKLRAGRVALLFGSEKRGLSNDDLSHCQWLLHIPTREGQPSMNLGQAVAVCLYEIVRNQFARSAPRKPEASSRESPFSEHPTSALQKWCVEEVVPATAGDLERITELILAALRASGYIKLRGARATEQKIRRMVRRLRIDSRDAELWLGMLRHMLWKMGEEHEPSE